MTEKRHKCPICGYYTFTEENGNEICPVCFWEDDLFDVILEVDESEESMANGISISEARENWKVMRCCRPDIKDFCRNPLPSELPWIYEHEPITTGDSSKDLINETMEVMNYKSNQINKRPDMFLQAADHVFHNCLNHEYTSNYEKQDMIDIYETLNSRFAFGIYSAIKLEMCYQWGLGVKQNYTKFKEYVEDEIEWSHAEKSSFQIEDGTLISYKRDDLSSVEIPLSVTSIGDSTNKPFKDHSEITKLHIFKPVNIASGAFENCTNLKKIYIYFGDLDKVDADFWTLYDEAYGEYRIALDAFAGCGIEEVIICGRDSGKQLKWTTTRFIQKFCRDSQTDNSVTN